MLQNLLHAMQVMKEKVEAEYNASQVSAVTQGLDGTPVVLIQVHPPCTSNFTRAFCLLTYIHTVQSLLGVTMASSNTDVAMTSV